MVYLQPLTRLIRFLERTCFQKNWWPWLLPLACWMVGIFFSWQYSGLGHTYDWLWYCYETKFDHVWEPVSYIYPSSAHQSKLDGRPFIPIVCHYLGLKRFGLTILYHLCGLISFRCIFELARRYSRDITIASLFTLGVAGLNCGMQAFTCSPMYDPVCLMLLLLAMLFPTPAPRIILFVLACLTDERAVCAFPVLIVDRFWELTGGKFSLKKLIEAALPLVIATALYIAVRAWFWLALNLTTPMGGFGPDILRKTWPVVPIAWLLCLEAYWLIPLLAVLVLIEQKQRAMTILFLIALATPVILPLAVFDLSRSLIYVLLPLLLALRIVVKAETRRLAEILLIAAAINLLIPNYLIFHQRPELVPSLPWQMILDRDRSIHP